MTSCMPIRQLIINGSLNELSSLSLLKKNSKFTRIKNKENHYYRDTLKASGEEGQTFKLSGEIELKGNGRIKWKESSISMISFRDRLNKENTYQISDRWQMGFNLKSLITSPPQNYLNLLISNGFTLRGGSGKDVIDLTSTLKNKKYKWPKISGGAGGDSITGSKGDDQLAASTSRDICDFGSGTNLARNVKDVLTGNAGRDTFYVDNGTHVTDIEIGEVIHLFNHNSYDLDTLDNKAPSFKHKSNRTIIRVGDLKVITNPARFDFAYSFYTPEYKMCRTDSYGTNCDMAWIPGEPEGYSFTAIEVT